MSQEDALRARRALELAVQRAEVAQRRLESAKRRRDTNGLKTADRGIRVDVTNRAATDVPALRGRSRALPLSDLFTAYCALGGRCSEFELDGFVHEVIELDSAELAVLSHAVWELTELPRHNSPASRSRTLSEEPRHAGGSAAAERSVVVDLPASPHCAAMARHVVSDTLRSWELADLIDTAELVVSELTTNAVVHAGGATVGLELARRSPVVRISVSDGSSSRPVVREFDPTAADGRGLRLVAALAIAWGSEQTPGGKRVWADIGRPVT